jgi:hypothetical protein
MMNKERLWISVLVVGLLLALAVGLIQAQEPATEGDLEENEAISPAAAMNDVIPIQGRLTDTDGNPLDGNYSIRGSIYDVAVGGVPRCTDTDTVAVTNGLFTMELDFCDPSDINGDQLYLGIKVGSDPEMTPRQPIHAVPYAWTVRPGAIIKGAVSYVFVPGNDFVKNADTDSTRWYMSGGSAVILRGAVAGTKNIRIPITIPAVLYGQPVRVSAIRIYYKCQNGALNYITQTQLYKHTDADSWDTLVLDNTDRQSNIATSYTLTTDTTNNTLSADQGILSLRLALAFNDNVNYILITGVRLTLVSNY